MRIDITGYVTETHGKDGFKIKVTSDKVQHLSRSNLQVLKEARIDIPTELYPFKEKFIELSGWDDPRRGKIDKCLSLGYALRKGDQIECSVCIVEGEIHNGQEAYVINRNPNNIETYVKFDLWLYPDPQLFKRLEVDSRESLKFRKQWFYTCENREKCEEITGSKWNDYRDKPWINKHPIRTCTATGNSGHSLRQDCGIISIYLKGVSDGETKTKKLHSRV